MRPACGQRSWRFPVKEEYEIKFMVQGFDRLLETFRSAGAEPLGSGDEMNLLFDSPDGALAGAGVVLRLRQTGPSVIMTVKERLHSGAVKGRREHEAALDTGIGEARGMLEALGYRLVQSYGKHRESWRLPCGVIACLDTLSFGSFLELEGRSPEEVALAAERLGFRMSQGIVEGYPGLQKRLEP